ncbi:germination lipoprotein GerS-related protein [Clostridium senegalense]|uniref:germination lipoprotein GerS-related protein n=1 Tax=Clostridium senegalense TaxID=1465809 RepID=UPI0002887177|nr:germination lipoprotein GerS-related protein [Clostridium senegalense]
MKSINKNTLLMIVAFFIIAITSVMFFKFKPQKPLAYEEIIENLKNINGYTANIKIDIKNAKQNLTYDGKQIYIREKGGQINLGENRCFTYDDKGIHVKDNNNGEKYDLPDGFDEVLKGLFVNEFINLINTSNEVVIENKELNNKQYLTISLLLPGYNRNIYKGIMYIDIKDGLPREYHILDEKENIRLICTYNKFLKLKEIENFEIN